MYGEFEVGIFSSRSDFCKVPQVLNLNLILWQGSRWSGWRKERVIRSCEGGFPHGGGMPDGRATPLPDRMRQEERAEYPGTLKQRNCRQSYL